jgi:hypothetical protein
LTGIFKFSSKNIETGSILANILCFLSMETEVVFTERLDKLTCAVLLIETVKYLLFHRYQMLLPFDQLKAEDERDRKSENARRSPRNRPLPSALKKKRQLIADVEELVLNLHQVFSQVNVSQVLLLFGATLVNPKEIYSIRFCNIAETNDADRLKAKCVEGKENGLNHRSKFVDKCCRKLARTLFTDPSLNERGELGCTSIHCFILAPRDMDTAWFRPKSSFKVPKKGKSCEIRIHGGNDGYRGTIDGNGIRRSQGNDGTSDGDVGILGDSDDEHDTLWFQAPVVIKGYREAYKETVESSIWTK